MGRNNLEASSTIADPSKILLAIASAALLALVTSPYWSVFCIFAKRHPGLIAVLIGVAGEVILDWRDASKDNRGRWKRFFMALLVIGLAVDLYEAKNADKEAVDATREI